MTDNLHKNIWTSILCLQISHFLLGHSLGTKSLYKEIFKTDDEASEDGRDNSDVKNICCFCKGLGFNSQHSLNSEQPFVTLIPGDLFPSFDLQVTRDTQGKHNHMQAKYCTHKVKFKNVNFKCFWFNVFISLIYMYSNVRCMLFSSKSSFINFFLL